MNRVFKFFFPTPMVGLWLFGMFLFAPGVILLGIGGRSIIREIASQHWPTVDGVVRSATITLSTSSSSHSSRPTYGAEIVYDFQVESHNYSSERISFSDFAHTKDYAQSFINKYPQGRKVTVHYQPSNPSLAVLEPGIGDLAWAFPVGGIVLLACGIMILAIREAGSR